VYVADLKNQIDNLRLPMSSVEAELARKREQAELTETTRAGLLTLRQHVAEIEEDKAGSVPHEAAASQAPRGRTDGRKEN
jgi:hypothetical protein